LAADCSAAAVICGTENIIVAVIMRTGIGSRLRSDFNAFLFASIGEDGNGLEVSVLSGLARSDLDPWQEAAQLARLPGKTATERLASLIGALPGRAWTRAEAAAAAARLVPLLPHTFAVEAAPGQPPHKLGGVMKSRPWLMYLVFMALVLGVQLFVANRQTQSSAGHEDIAPSAQTSAPPPASNITQSHAVDRAR